MTNILIFSPLSLNYGRGGEFSIIELASSLKKYFNVTLVDTNKILGKESKILSKKILNDKLEGIKRDEFKLAIISIFNKYFSIPYPYRFLKLLKRVKESDVVIFSISGIGTNIIFLILRLLTVRPRFIVSHRIPLYSFKKHSFHNLRLKISFVLFTIFKKRFYHHTISYRRKKFLEAYYKPDKVFHIRHCIELNKFLQDFEAIDQDNCLKFIYVGNLDSVDKGIDILIHAIENILKENKTFKTKFEFCGKGPLESKIKDLESKFPNHVKFNGYVSYNEVPKYYGKSDVFLFTSRREAFGRVIIEALASKLLIISTKTIGSNEILKGKEFAFFLNTLNTLEIEATIKKVYNLWENEPQKFNKLKKLARRHALENYDYSHELSGFVQLINSIIKRR
ncbi:MAG: glycosyltransferase family 4 protein [Candidatus Hodarchaeota archaeon]